MQYFEISWGAFTPKLMKTYRVKTLTDLTPEEFYNFDTRFVLPSPTEQNTDFTKFFKDEQLPANVIFDEWGIGSVPTLYEIPDFKYHPLAIMSTVEEIENWPWPDLGEEYRYKFRKQMSYSVEMAVSCWHRHIYWIRRYHGIILWHLLMLPRAYNPFRANRNYLFCEN